MGLEAGHMPELTVAELRETVEALQEMESQERAGDPNWAEFHMVRRLLGQMLEAAEELEKEGALRACGQA